MADPHRLKHSARLAKQRGGFWTLDTGADDRYGPADRLPWPGDAWSESHTGLGRLVLNSRWWMRAGEWSNQLLRRISGSSLSLST
jgi:hypothetical protein